MSNTSYSIDFAFIEELEGGCSTRGYVPDPENSMSGVTIATGFDLGQRHLDDLKQINLSDELCEVLTPYLGITRYEAENALQATPLLITQEQAQEIDQCTKASFIANLATRYDDHSDTSFNELPRQMQTVIASVAFQYGSLSRKTPNFWRQVTTQSWHDAINNLNNFGDRYTTRRRKEATLMQEGLSA